MSTALVLGLRNILGDTNGKVQQLCSLDSRFVTALLSLVNLLHPKREILYLKKLLMTRTEE